MPRVRLPAITRAAVVTFSGLWMGNASAQDVHTAPRRIVVAMIEGDGGTGGVDPAGAMLSGSLLRALLEVPGLCPLGDSAVQFALTHAGTRPIADDGVERWTRIGILAEAEWIVWGRCRRDDDGCRAMLNVADSMDGMLGEGIRAEASDWQGVREQLFDGIVARLDLRIAVDVRARALAPLAGSDAALELLGHALALIEADDDAAALAEALERAARADPASVEILAYLSRVLVGLGDVDEAARRADEARRMVPNDPRAEVATAIVLLARGNRIAARIRTERARDGAPRWADPPLLLGHIHAADDDWPAAIAAFEAAVALAPFSAHAHASLAHAWAEVGERERALDAIEAARRLDPDDLSFLREATLTYARLDMAPEVLVHSERFVRLARRLGVLEALAARFEKNAAQMRARLQMHTVDAPRPRRYTATQLSDALDARLTPGQRRLVVHPFASDAAIDTWARRVAGEDGSPLDRSRRIFDELVARSNDGMGAGTRTALEVRDRWSDPTTAFNCQELTKLFLAMARAVGIDAFYVHLERDHEDRIVYHDCAAVVDDDQVVLVDPAYQWFGPPHRELTILDDVQAIAHQLLQRQRGLSHDEAIERCAGGIALHPEFPWARVQLAWALSNAGRAAEAADELDVAERLEPCRWDVELCRGVLALNQDELDTAASWLGSARTANPDHPAVNRAWGRLLQKRGSLAAARDALRAALRRENDPRVAEDIRIEIAILSRRLRDR